MSPIEASNLAHIWQFARDFPDLPRDLIDRPHLLETMSDVLLGDSQVVFLEGEEGDGATTTLGQFCKNYPDTTFSLFVKPASRFAYSPDYLRLTLAEHSTGSSHLRGTSPIDRNRTVDHCKSVSPNRYSGRGFHHRLGGPQSNSRRSGSFYRAVDPSECV